MPAKRFTIKENLDFFRKVHGDRYNYDNVDLHKSYVTSDKINIICEIHGEFSQSIRAHKNGQGCPLCAKSTRTLTTAKFIQRSNIIHKNKYDYSKTNYINSSTKLTIICPLHGEFEQRPDMHLSGQGCKKCGLINMQNKITSSTNEFINKSNQIHNNKYDYSKTNYINSEEYVTITCPEHGDFKQIAYNHLSGKGCKKCANEKNSLQFSSTLEEFIDKAKKIHGNKYSYHKVEYKNSLTNVWIHCEETDADGHSHGDFLQLPVNHLQGSGCPKCVGRISKPELELHKLFEGIDIQTNTKRIITNELDIYIPSKKLAIEYNGLYWHNEVNRPAKKYHLKKTEACEKQGIQLIHIFEDEWLEKPEIVKSRINNLLGLNKERIFARKCIIKEVNNTDTRLFLETNHIQGFVGSKISYGLYYNNVLVSLMTFGSLRKNLGSASSDDTEYELLRFCNKLNTSVVGGASKLFKHFLKLHNPSKVISYADRRWSLGKLYEQLGFEFSHNSVPNYFYVIGQKRKNRFNFRKDILISKYGCSPEDTEHNFCFNQGWYRIYDCGVKVYVWNQS